MGDGIGVDHRRPPRLEVISHTGLARTYATSQSYLQHGLKPRGPKLGMYRSPWPWSTHNAAENRCAARSRPVNIAARIESGPKAKPCPFRPQLKSRARHDRHTVQTRFVQATRQPGRRG